MYFETEYMPLRSSKVVDFVTNRKRVCEHSGKNCWIGHQYSNRGPTHILPRFRDAVGFLLRTATPPLFHPNFGGVLLKLD